MLHLVFSGQSLADFKQIVLDSEVSEEHYQSFLAYAASVFNNCGNYKSFGDDKFVPNLTEELFLHIVHQSVNY